MASAIKAKIKTRKQRRDERAEKLAREIRYQMAKYGGVADNEKVFALLRSWMRVAKKNMYIRP
jgi:hypothetical protein